MKLHNRMENAVINIIERIFETRDDICKCNKCKMDIAAIALNNLPPKYVVTDKGELFTKVKEMELQFEVNIIKEVAKAIEIVKNNPRHDTE